MERGKFQELGTFSFESGDFICELNLTKGVDLFTGDFNFYYTDSFYRPVKSYMYSFTSLSKVFEEAKKIDFSKDVKNCISELEKQAMKEVNELLENNLI